MNENAKKWIDSLRSGNYEQGQRYLRTDKGFCCLGVACDLYSKETGKVEWKKNSNLSNLYYFGENGFDLPRKVSNWLGLSGSSGGFYSTGKQAAQFDSSLAVLNDTGSDFTEIANLIASEPSGLFE